MTDQFELEVFVGGYGDVNFRIRWNEGRLVYWRESLLSFEKQEEAIIHPTNAQWQHFWKFLNECREWEKKYKKPGKGGKSVGVEWEVHAKRKYYFLKSSGKDAFPENFDQFVEEVRKLLGGRQFGYQLSYNDEWFGH